MLDLVDFRIDRGEILTIVGTQQLRQIPAPARAARRGEGEPGGGSRARGLRLSYVPQRLVLDPTLPMTVTRFVGLPRWVARSDAAPALETAGVPGIGRREMAELSGAQFQRVLLARPILGAPDLLILDEAAAGLDQPAAAFYRRIEEVSAETGRAIMVTHDLHVVMSA